VCVCYLYGCAKYIRVGNIMFICICAAPYVYVPMEKYIRSSWPNKIVANPKEEVARHRRWRGVLFSIIGSVSCARFLLIYVYARNYIVCNFRNPHTHTHTSTRGPVSSKHCRLGKHSRIQIICLYTIIPLS